VGGERRDDADVVWLQAETWYADLRIPHHDAGGPVEAFAGQAAWASPAYTWFHDIDWAGSFPEDVGLIERDGRDLIERGTFTVDGAPVPYEERWERQPVAAPRLVARLEDPTVRACVVRVGDHAIALADERPAGGGFAARREELVAGAWSSRFTRSIDAAPLGPLPLDGCPAVGERLVLGRFALTVVESVAAATDPFEEASKS
jgi:hypothetical protein